MTEGWSDTELVWALFQAALSLPVVTFILIVGATLAGMGLATLLFLLVLAFGHFLGWIEQLRARLRQRRPHSHRVTIARVEHTLRFSQQLDHDYEEEIANLGTTIRLPRRASFTKDGVKVS